MIVSKEWLAEYVDLPMPVDDLTERLTLAGLNLESVTPVGGDVAIDLEVTSNRPDCLGHVGVAREVAVLYGSTLRRPDPAPPVSATPVSKLTGVAVECPDLCPRYTARVLRGVQVGPSPEWLARRLRTLGIAVINNVVDVTNYVMMESGQPLHAFDLAKLRGGRLVVRRARAAEPFTAIDHRAYTLTGDEVVIADAERPVALAGVMGGAETEVSATTTDLLIEAADFAPLAVRGAARRHTLHSPSSYRFERGVDPEGIDWASRRCCELILDVAGGELAAGVVDVAAPAPPRGPVTLRYAQIKRLLGIEVAPAEVRRVLSALGCVERSADAERLVVAPPPWRADLTREADLLEEVARIHGYDRIPEDVGVRMAPSSRGRQEVALERVRQVMTAAGFDEALTLSAVEPEWVDALRPWTTEPPLATATPVLRRATCLRQSVVPSLLACRRHNETLSNPTIELFEVAKVYLPRAGALPEEKRVLAATSGGGFRALKGVVEGVVARLAPTASLSVGPGDEPLDEPLLEPGRGCRLLLNGHPFGVLGELSPAGRERFGLRSQASVFELDTTPLVEAAELVARAGQLSAFPPVSRDLNVVFDVGVRWAEVERIARAEGGDLVERVTFQDDDYRDPQRLGPGRKSVFFTVLLRSPQGTLTGDQADAVRDRIVAALTKGLGGTLRV